MSTGSSTPPTQTTTTTAQMSPEQQQLFKLALPGVKDFAATVPQRYQGSTVAGFDPAQVAGQQMALGGAGTQQGLAESGAGASNFWLSPSVWDPANNPALKGAVDAAVRPITENYQQVVRPALRDEFTGAGQIFGGSNRFKTENAAANTYLRNVGDTSSKLVNDAYSTNVTAQLRALGLLPQTQQAAIAPGITTSGVGDVRQNLAQQLINADVGNYNYDQLAPFLQSKEIMSLISGIPGGTTTALATGSVPQKNQLTSALGGAATGASLGTAIMPGYGTAAGAGIGALLSFL